MKVSAIIVAAGSGTRLGLETPKAFVPINGATLLSYVLRTIRAVEALDEMVLAVPSGTHQLARAEVNAAGLQIPVKITEGGRERQDSVRLGLRLTSAESELIVIHDAARPFATPEMFSSCIAAATQSGGSIVAIPVADTLKQVAHGTVISTAGRDGLWQAQTPQSFHRELLIKAHERAQREHITVTDDAHLCEYIGVKLQVVQGSVSNLKITTPDDLRLGEAIARFGFRR
jgi:2-C-methyl-D-erythritol 4-phosphate cytidylyltransferase/2-C-methyl-D-erythritol 2,4-cyclodiphosphate synthase